MNKKFPNDYEKLYSYSIKKQNDQPVNELDPHEEEPKNDDDKEIDDKEDGKEKFYIIQLYDTSTIRCFQLKIYDLLDVRRFLDVQQCTIIRFKKKRCLHSFF